MDNTNKRKSISKKLRFEVFKRDCFTCQYCSSKPPKVPLEVDHIIPVCKGGKNNIDNLITACFDCNRGKSGNELTSIPKTILEKSQGKKVALLQYKEYQKILLKEKMQIELDINSVELIYNSVFSDYCFTDKFKISVKKFIKEIGIESVIDAMETSCNRIYDEDKALKYFCGICWNKIKENQ
jgi:hypothetical protein